MGLSIPPEILCHITVPSLQQLKLLTPPPPNSSVPTESFPLLLSPPPTSPKHIFLAPRHCLNVLLLRADFK